MMLRNCIFHSSQSCPSLRVPSVPPAALSLPVTVVGLHVYVNAYLGF